MDIFFSEFRAVGGVKINKISTNDFFGSLRQKYPALHFKEFLEKKLYLQKKIAKFICNIFPSIFEKIINEYFIHFYSPRPQIPQKKYVYSGCGTAPIEILMKSGRYRTPPLPVFTQSYITPYLGGMDNGHGRNCSTAAVYQWIFVLFEYNDVASCSVFLHKNQMEPYFVHKTGTRVSKFFYAFMTHFSNLSIRTNTWEHVLPFRIRMIWCFRWLKIPHNITKRRDIIRFVNIFN